MIFLFAFIIFPSTYRKFCYQHTCCSLYKTVLCNEIPWPVNLHLKGYLVCLGITSFVCSGPLTPISPFVSQSSIRTSKLWGCYSPDVMAPQTDQSQVISQFEILYLVIWELITRTPGGRNCTIQTGATQIQVRTLSPDDGLQLADWTIE